MKDSSYLPAYEDGTDCSETLAYRIHTPGNHTEASLQHSELGESLKLRVYNHQRYPSRIRPNIPIFDLV
jgi:hypothetical protein